MLNYPVGSQRTTLSDRNGPSCPSLSDFDYILDLLSADFDFKFRCTRIIYHTGCLITLSDRNGLLISMHSDPFRTRTLFPPLHIFATDFDFTFRCTRTFPHSHPFPAPLHVLPLGRDNFDVLGHFPRHLHALMRRMIISGIPGIHVPVFKGGSWVWQVTESKLLNRIS